ncbi:replication initiation protein [Moraxella osloensis]|nr:replication initiation protein [Moraxella osloensis]MBW4016788.1 replication initiation protein [Moraxella osloensis]MBW4019184.1 replication initiation protein [Moraxella osloensis]TGP42218.1 RepB family plasmid replication initiator protein [bacterium M00.F.Ca.ET.230.01.1.1]VWX31809.1 RepB family plasmid replication initiator protein [Moraxellaceae bacterium 17A]
MKKTINIPEKDTALFGFRNNLSLSEHRIFLYLLKSAFKHNKGLTSAKKDLLELYITFELAQKLDKETGSFCTPCKAFSARRDNLLLFWNSKPEELSPNQVELTAKIFSQLEYKNGFISYQFNSQIVPLLEVVLRKFDKYGYDIASLAKANSKYTPRLQEMLLLGRGSGQKHIYKIEQLRTVLLTENTDAYSQSPNEFIRHCLEPAVQEISKISGEKLTFTLIEDKKIQFSKQSLRFLLSNNSSGKISNNDNIY